MLGQTITGALANIPFPFGIDSQGNYGYRKDGADTVTPFSSGSGDPLKDVSGSIQWYASYRGNTATIPINCEGWPVIKFYVSYSQYATSISSYLEKLDGTTTSSVTRTYNTWYTIDNSNREYKKLNVVVAGTVSQYTGYGTVQYQLEQGVDLTLAPPTTGYVIPYGGNNITISPKIGSVVAIACSAVAVPSAGGTSANINITSTGLTGVINEFSNISGSMSGMKIELLLGVASSSTVTFNMTSNYNHLGAIYYTPA